MWDRSVTFSDSGVIDRLSREFIPYAGDTHELQTGSSPERAWFLAMAKGVNPRIEENQTSQGFYVASPEGKGYGFNNNRSVERVHGLLDKGLAAHGHPARTPAAKTPAAGAPSASTSVVRVFARVRPVPEGAAASNRNVARDHLWIYPDELQAIAAGQGSAFPLPASLARRIARFHLVDNVRGEPPMWGAQDLRGCTFTVKPEGDGYRIEGKFSMAAEGGARGMEGSLEGWLEIDEAAWKVRRFLAHAGATAWGRGSWTPNPPEGRFQMVFAMVEADDEPARHVAPQGALWGAEYRGR